jgi:haloacid dehalogenase superfamily, subfamily IA, variant 3 with third motif having DD or ED/haloacid dehalogenase superfamily, subfamily IA, variant 1 with third motif having Dx(3-4)D or Dx(3-4)E
MIVAILFDIYGTLIDIQTDEISMDAYDILSKWLEYKHVYISPDQIKWFYHEEFARRLGPPDQRRAESDAFREITDEYSARARGTELFLDSDVTDVFRTILARCCNIMSPEVDHLPEDCSHLFRTATRKRMFIYPTVKPGLDQIKKGYRLGIVSNAQEAFTLPELDLYGLQSYFETIVLSSQAGVKKPNSKIFEQALDNLNIEPWQAAFVGNDLFADILGAGKIGMKTIYVGRGGQDIRGAVPDAIVPDVNIHEVKNIVDRWNAEEKK